MSAQYPKDSNPNAAHFELLMQKSEDVWRTLFRRYQFLTGLLWAIYSIYIAAHAFVDFKNWFGLDMLGTIVFFFASLASCAVGKELRPWFGLKPWQYWGILICALVPYVGGLAAAVLTFMNYLCGTTAFNSAVTRLKSFSSNTE